MRGPFDRLRVRQEPARGKRTAQWHAELVEALKVRDSRVFEAMTFGCGFLIHHSSRA
jgi:predicted alpha/beta hydrolase family esterase